MLIPVNETTQKILDVLHRGGRFRYCYTLPGRKSYWGDTSEPFHVPEIEEDIYFGVHPTDCEKSSHKRGTNEDVCAINCLFAEFDPDGRTKDELSDHIELLPISPSVLIDSGRGYHGYWILRDTFYLNTSKVRERAARVQKAFVAAVGGDPAAKDLARILRVPGTRNYKDIFKPDYPLVSIVHSDLDQLYEMEELEKSAGVTDQAEESRVISIPPYQQTADAYGTAALSGEAIAVLTTPEGGRNKQLNESAFKVGTLVSSGAVNEQDAKEILTDAAIATGLEPREAHKTVRSGLEAGKKRPRVLGPPKELNNDNSWPAPPDDVVYHGPVGEFVKAIGPHTEADPVALLSQALIYLGNMMGRNAYFRVEADRHYPNEYAVLVGRSSKARKGTSAGHVRHLCQQIDPEWEEHRIRAGLSTGEGLIYHVRDPEEESDIGDPGVLDKRLLVDEAEFASVLKVSSREGNTLSPVLRNSFDGRPLETLTRNNPIRATATHVSIIGHSVKEEIKRYLTETDIANGFGNRFMWFAVKRSKLLPHGGNLDTRLMEPIYARLRSAVFFGSKDREVKRDAEANEYWTSIYPKLAAERTGLLGAITGRGEAHTMRLALIYALLDESPVIRLDHIQAAYALWLYADRSAAYIFGSETLGNSTADQILKSLKQSTEGLTQTEISRIFNGHVEKLEIDSAIALLAEQRRIVNDEVRTGGRRKTIYRLT